MTLLKSEEYRVFDFLRGTEPYKARWSRRSEQDDLVFISSTLAGQATVGWDLLRRSIRRNGRKAGILKWIQGSD